MLWLLDRLQELSLEVQLDLLVGLFLVFFTCVVLYIWRHSRED
jgi:hypothetical protein